MSDTPTSGDSAVDAAQKRYSAAIYSDLPEVGNQAITAIVQQIEASYGRTVVMLIQGGDGELSSIDHQVYEQFLRVVTMLPQNKPVLLILHSPGGFADCAYRIAQLLRKHCGGYIVLVPAYAKSAATLLALGADKIVLGRFAELGPLDAQVMDQDREQRISALEVVQSLERLNSEAMQAVDANMFVWAGRSGKRLELLLPLATRFVADMMGPLFGKIDAVRFTQMARVLKIGQDYAERLLQKNYSDRDASDIALKLTKDYSDHGFVIDSDEARRLHLDVEEPPDSINGIVFALTKIIENATILGQLVEGGDESKTESNNSQNGKQANQNRRRRRARN